MLKKFTLLACLAALPLMAETIGNVDYQLPKLEQGWKVAHELNEDENIKSTTVIYVPADAISENEEESFGAHVNDQPSLGLDQASIKESFEALFPNQEVQVTVLESDETSTLFEWSTGTENRMIYSLVRTFDTDGGSTLLMYQTDRAKNLETHRPAIIQALKDAKIKAPQN